MNKYWNFKVFISENGDNEINDWLDSLSTQARKAQEYKARIKRIIVHLENQKDMHSKYFSSYKNHNYIYRLKFRFHDDLYRVFGCFGPGENDFTLLIPVRKVAGRLEPKNAVQIAEGRRELINKDRRRYTDDFV